MSKYPVEIFGHHCSDKTKSARNDQARHWCPFVDKVCYKQSRLIKHPFGVCSAQFGNAPIALCPRRFLETNRVFADIANTHFKTTHDIIIFSEVGLTGIGNFDFVLVRHKPMSSEVVDFVIVEFQTGQTTGTGKLVAGLKDFMDGENVSEKTYNFGLNVYDIWKRTFTQVLTKGIILENWGHKIYFVHNSKVVSSNHALGINFHISTFLQHLNKSALSL